MIRKTIAAGVIVSGFLVAPAALADQTAPDAPCKDVPSAADHCDWNGKNDVTQNHPQSDAHANAHSDCNARVCEPEPTPTPTPTPTYTPSFVPVPESPAEVAQAEVTPEAEAPAAVSAPAPAKVAKQPAKVNLPAKATVPNAVPAGDGSSQQAPISAIAAIVIAAITAAGSGLTLIKQ